MNWEALCTELDYHDGLHLSAEVEKVQVWPEQGMWRLILSVDEPIPGAVLAEVSKRLLEKTEGLETVEIAVLARDPGYCLKSILEMREEDLLSCIAAINPQIKERIAFGVENDHLIINCQDYQTWEAVRDYDVGSLIEEWMLAEYRMVVLVSARCEETSPCIIEEKGEGPVLNVVPTRGWGKQKKRRAEKKKGKNGKSDLLETAKSWTIAELQEGLSDVVIEGQIIGKKVISLKEGKFVERYTVTDFTDTIWVKNFDEESFEEGEWIRVLGNVSFDRFENDVTMVARDIIRIPARLREDLSEVKRVELHLHTKMSAMDSVCDLEELFETASRFGHKCLAITDHGTLQAFPEAHELARRYKIKVIYGVEGYLVDKRTEDRKEEKVYHIVILAANQTGLKNLYRLVSRSYLENFYYYPRIYRDELIQCREGLLLGSACERGEVVRAYLRGADEDELRRIAMFYDYLEIQPLGNNEFLIRDGTLRSREDLMEMNRRILELGRATGRPVVATGDVHFLEPHHEVFRRILLSSKGFDDAEHQAPLYYRTTEEMLDEFRYLGESEALEVVVENPLRIAAQCDEIRPVPEGHYSPRIEGAAERITRLVWERAVEIYGDPLPPQVKGRLERELDSIITHGFSELYLIAHELVKKSNSEGYLVGSRGSVGSSLAAFLTGITEVNPLCPHYVCQCGYSEFYEDGSVACGPDMPKKNCPKCGKEMRRDGFDIPFETFLGFEGDKVPDIDLNFSGDYQSKAHQYVEELFGKDHVFRAGTISTIAEKTAYGFVKNYAEENKLHYRNAEIERLVQGIAGVRRTTGQHPGGLIVVPKDHEIYEFCPIQHPADDSRSEVITTHFDYEALSGVLVKLDVLGHDDPTMIRSLEDLTGHPATSIPLDEPETMKLFSGVEPLGVTPEDIRSEVGTYGIPEFGTRFVRQMLQVTRPRKFSELIRISGLSHGTDVWNNNAHDLIRQNIATLNEVIATRDDIMTYLIHRGLNKKQAFKIMENVRKGKGLTEEEIQVMRENQVPDWYISSCQKIKYMFPKAHAVAYVMMAFRIAYYKVYYPLAFYASYFSIRSDEFDEVMLRGYDAILNRLDELERRSRQSSERGRELTAKERNLITALEIALEMHARGFRFYPVDLYQSEARRFKIYRDGLLLPFTALPGVGENAAQSLVEARSAGRFTSLEDLRRRARINKTVIDILDKYGCLRELPQTEQVSLFVSGE